MGNAATENSSDASPNAKEVYARFGLAMYQAQVLEHGLVNAMLLLDLVPNRLHLMQHRAEWNREVDAFMDQHFETTMGRMLNSLRKLTDIDPTLEDLLTDALRRRNWLAHDFFRERAVEFLSTNGRHQMIEEVDEAYNLLERADDALEATLVPLRKKIGVTDEMVGKILDEYKASAP